MAKSITTLAELQKSAQTYQKELLIMPMLSAQDTLRHMSGRPGTRGKRTVGELSGDVELAPWKNDRKAQGDFKITPRTLETFLGNCAYEFAPNDIWDTVHGSLQVMGQPVKDTEVAKAILFYAAGRLGKKLNMSIWNAERQDDGNTTAALFDGFDTIAAKEIAAGNLSADKGNYLHIADGISAENAVDQLKYIYNSASDELQNAHTKLFLPRSIYNMYCEDYKATTGATPYNTEFKKTFLEGTDDLCELVPLASKKGSNFIQLTPQTNMLYGYGNGLAEESVAVEKYGPWMLTLEAAMYFGVQYESISPERLMVAKVGQ